MDLVKPPTADDDCRDLWQIVAKIARIINALAGARWIPSFVRNRLLLTESNATFEFMGGGTGTSTPILLPWQPYAAPYVGTGTPPSDQGLMVMINPGFVWDGSRLWLPARRNIVISVPPNCTDGFFVWLDASVGVGGIVTALDYGFGTTLPAGVTVEDDTDAGDVPPHAYDLLMILTSTATAVELGSAAVMRNTPLSLVPQVVTLDGRTRMIYQPPSPITSIPYA